MKHEVDEGRLERESSTEPRQLREAARGSERQREPPCADRCARMRTHAHRRVRLQEAKVRAVRHVNTYFHLWALSPIRK